MAAPPVTLVLMTYNQAPFLAEAIASALAQDYPRLTVVISDNASTDDTPAVVTAALAGYDGPHRLVRRRYDVNLGGPAEHVTAALAAATDEVVVFLHGDDVAEATRVRALAACFTDPAVQLAHSAAQAIDAAGEALELLRYPDPPPAMQLAHFARVQGHVLGATLALRRDLAARFPPLDGRVYEDMVLPFRAALAGRVAYLPAPLVRYRRHGRNATQAGHDLSTRAAAAAAAGAALARLRIVAELRRADLAHWLRTQPAAVDAVDLERLIAASLAEAEDAARLALAGLGGRLAAAGRIARRAASPRAAAMALFQALWPAGYIAWRRRRRAKAR
jgi:glycosyltransferase involved in cell wall biosynthesis